MKRLVTFAMIMLCISCKEKQVAMQPLDNRSNEKIIFVRIISSKAENPLKFNTYQLRKCEKTCSLDTITASLSPAMIDTLKARIKMEHDKYDCDIKCVSCIIPNIDTLHWMAEVDHPHRVHLQGILPIILK